MAPLPLPERATPTPAGFLAALKSSEKDASTSTSWKAPSAESRARALELMSAIQRDEGSKLAAWAQRRRRGTGRNEAMYATIRRLCDHTLPLADQTRDPQFATTVKESIGEVWDDLDGRIEVLQREPPFEPFGEEEATVLAMSQWFKYDFMTWVDPIKCPKCQGETRFSGMAAPTQQEKEMGGGRVESHRCVVCQSERRFMRLNEPKSLLKTREGRCGEFAQLFYVLLQARGLHARYIWNSEDHVWCEYWSPTLKHWVHVDSCEAEISKPLLYDQGWGKKQAFCLSFGQDGASDVTEAYVSDWSGECQRRRAARRWDETELKKLLMEITLELRNRMTDEERAGLEIMDEEQAEWIASTRQRIEEAAQEELRGRDSGTQDWKEARGEAGKESH